MRFSEALRRHKELTEAFPPDETTNGPHDHGGVVDPEIDPGLSARAFVCFGTESL